MRDFIKDFWLELLGGLYWGTAVGLMLVGVSFLIPWAFFAGSLLILAGVTVMVYLSTDDPYGSDHFV